LPLFSIIDIDDYAIIIRHIDSFHYFRFRH